jgi:hypothetical protein
MRHPLFKGVVLGSITAMLVLMAGTALAGTGVGGVFNLGRTNTVNKTTALTGQASAKMLQVTNKGTGPALGLSVAPGKAPLTVNSAAKVANLNADTIDGKHADELTGAQFFNAHVTYPISAEFVDLMTLPGFGTIQASGYSQGALMFTSTSTETLHWIEVGAWGGSEIFSGDLAPEDGLWFVYQQNPPDTAPLNCTFALFTDDRLATIRVLSDMTADKTEKVLSIQAVVQ